MALRLLCSLLLLLPCRSDEVKPVVTNYLGCFDTRERESYGFRKKHWASSLEDVMFKCSMYRYAVLECPSETRAVFWCTNQLFPPSKKLSHGNCYGNPEGAPELNRGSNGLCSGPFWWPLLEGSVALGGWHRGAFYSVVRDVALLAESPGKDVTLQEDGLKVHEISDDGSYFFVEKKDWQSHFGLLQSEEGSRQVVEQLRDGAAVWTGSVNITLPRVKQTVLTTTTTTSSAPEAGSGHWEQESCEFSFPVPKLRGLRKCMWMVLAAAGSEEDYKTLRDTGIPVRPRGKGETPAYEKNLWDYRYIGMPGTLKACKNVQDNISDTVTFSRFPPGVYELRLQKNGRKRLQTQVVKLTGDCKVKAGCATTGTSGAGADKPCIFPFNYEGIIYRECTTVKASAKWCATKTDDDGHYISGEWGYCGEACSEAVVQEKLPTPATYAQVGTGVSCGKEAYRSGDSPEKCREWCEQHDECKAYVTFEDSPCDSCLAFTANDCGPANQQASECTGQISAFNKIRKEDSKEATMEECQVTFSYANCKDGVDDRDITVGFSAAFQGYPLSYSVEYSAEGGSNLLGCRGTHRDVDLKFTDAQGNSHLTTLVEGETAAVEVTNFRFSSNCPMKKAASPEPCSVTFLDRNCGTGESSDKTVKFTASFADEPLEYNLEYGDEGGTNTDSCAGTYREASISFMGADTLAQSVVLVDSSGDAVEVSNLRFSRNCPMKEVTKPALPGLHPDWSKPIGSTMTALSSPTSSDGPVQNLLDASTNSYANFAGTGWAFPVWVVFDLHSSIQVAGFEVKPHKAAGAPKRLALGFCDTSTAGPWLPVDTYRVKSEWSGVKRWPFADSYSGRFWKLTFLESFDGSAPKINYVRFYPPEGGINERRAASILQTVDVLDDVVEQPSYGSSAPNYNSVTVKMGAMSEAGMQHLLIMDILVFDSEGNQLQIKELRVLAEKNGADALAPGIYVGGARMESITDGSHTTLPDGGWVNGEMGHDPHIGVHGSLSENSDIFQVTADGDIVRLQLDFCRKNDAPALKFVRGDGAESLSPAQSGMEGTSEQIHFPAPPSTLQGHRMWASELGQWQQGDQLQPVTVPDGWAYSFPSFASGQCAAAVKSLVAASKALCEKSCADAMGCHFFSYDAGSGDCKHFASCEVDRMDTKGNYMTYQKKLACSTAIATAPEVALTSPLPGFKTRHQCQAACSWQGASFVQYRKDDDDTVCRCGLPGLSFYQVMVDVGTNRKPYDSHEEAAPCTDLEGWSNGWCLMEICPLPEDTAASETEYSAFGTGGHCSSSMLRKSKGVPSLTGCQGLCTREADCRYVSYDAGGVDNGACVRYAKCQEDAMVVPPDTAFSTFQKSSKGMDRPPSWRLFTSSTWRRGAKNERNCWKISDVQFFASEDCETMEFGVPPEKQIFSGAASGSDASKAFRAGAGAELRGADGDFGSSEVWLGAKELGGVRCIRFVQEASAEHTATQSGTGCRPLSNLEVQIGDFEGANWKTVVSIPWSVKKDGVNKFSNLDRASAAVFQLDASLAPPKTLSCVFQVNDRLKSVLYGGVDLMGLAGMGEGNSEKVHVVSFTVKPGAYLAITGEDAEGDFHDTGGFWADCGSVAPAANLQSSWELFCSNNHIDVAHREGAGAGWAPGSANSFKAKTKRIFGGAVDKASLGMEAAKYCTFRMLPKKALSFQTLRSKGLYGLSELDMTAFNERFRDARTGIIRRECQDCEDTHKKIYMRRKTLKDTWDAYSGIVVRWDEQGIHKDFDLYSTLQDALDDRNAWARCDGVPTEDAGFPGSCGPREAPTEPQWTSLSPGHGRQNYKYAVYQVGQRMVMNFANHGEGLCSGVPLRAKLAVESAEACQELCAQEEDCIYVSHGDPNTLSCMQFSGASCGSLQFPACGGLSCGFQTWAKQRDDRVNCDFVMNDQVVSVYYGINITELVSNTPGNAKERRRLSVVSKPGEYLIITGISLGGDMKFQGGFWADCGSSAPPDKLDDTWESYCSDEPIDQLHQKGGGDGWRPPMVRSTGQAAFPITLGDDGKKYCAYRAVVARIRPVWTNAWCKSATVFDTWPGMSGLPTAFACSSACTGDARCRFFGFGKDPRATLPRCAFFETCRERRTYDKGDFHVYKAEEVRDELQCTFKPSSEGIQDIFYGAYIPQKDSVHITVRPGTYLVFFGRTLGRGFWADCGGLAPRNAMQDAWEAFCDTSLDTVHKMGGGTGWRTPVVSADDELVGFDGKEHCAFRLNPHALASAPEVTPALLEPIYTRALSSGKRWLRGPGGPQGSDVAKGEGTYLGGKYEVYLNQSLEDCQTLCSDREWCTGFNYKHTDSYSTVPDWKASTCQLVSQLLATETGVTNLDSYQKQQRSGPVTAPFDATTTTTTTMKVYNFTLVGQGICASMERLLHQPDVGSRETCQEICNRIPKCHAYSYCSDSEISGCVGFCGLYTGTVHHADNQNTSSCWAKTTCRTIVLDTPNATVAGEWKSSRVVPGFVGRNYLVDKRTGGAVTWEVPEGTFMVTIGYTSYANRASNAPVTITTGGRQTTVRVNQKQGRSKLLGKFTFLKGDTVQIGTFGADGKVVADSLRLSSCADDLNSELESPDEAPETEWLLVFRQTYPSLFQKGQWSLNAKSPDSDNFALLDELETFKIDGVFTFRLRWPKEPQPDQIWRQTSNPVTATHGRVDGYQAVDAPHTAMGWGGLRHGTGTALLDGSVSMEGHHAYAVGLMTQDGSAIPGPGEPVQQVELYVEKFKEIEVPDEAALGNEVVELRGQCRMLPPIRADAPGAELVSESTEPWYDDCSCLCSQTVGCRALLYRDSTGLCQLLAQPWKHNYLPPAADDDIVASTKLCGDPQCPYRYFMLEVVEAGDATGWKLAELELRGRFGKIAIPREPSNIYLLDGRPRIARSLTSSGTDAIQVTDGDLTTSVVTDPDYSSTMDDSVQNGVKKDRSGLAAKLIIDFEGEQHVREFVLTSGLGEGANMTKVSSKVGNPRTFVIRGSNDFSSWSTLARLDGLEALETPGQAYVVPLMCPMQI